MKRIIAFIVAIVYITSTSGAVITTHYCAGKIKSVSLNIAAKTCGCKPSDSKGCCKTEQKLVKLNDTHKSSNVTYIFNVDDHVIVPNYIIDAAFVISNSIIIFQRSNSSPPPLPVALYIYNCSILI